MVQKITILLVLVAVTSAMAQGYRQYGGPFNDEDDYMTSIDQDNYGPRYGRYGPSGPSRRRFRWRGGRGSDSSDSDSSDSDSSSDESGEGFDPYGFLSSIFGPRRPSYGPRGYGRPYRRPSYENDNDDDQEMSNYILTQ